MSEHVTWLRFSGRRHNYIKQKKTKFQHSRPKEVDQPHTTYGRRSLLAQGKPDTKTNLDTYERLPQRMSRMLYSDQSIWARAKAHSESMIQFRQTMEGEIRQILHNGKYLHTTQKESSDWLESSWTQSSPPVHGSSSVVQLYGWPLAKQFLISPLRLAATAHAHAPVVKPLYGSWAYDFHFHGEKGDCAILLSLIFQDPVHIGHSKRMGYREGGKEDILIDNLLPRFLIVRAWS